MPSERLDAAQRALHRLQMIAASQQRTITVRPVELQLLVGPLEEAVRALELQEQR
jgi:hypothetical protein